MNTDYVLDSLEPETWRGMTQVKPQEKILLKNRLTLKAIKRLTAGLTEYRKLAHLKL